MVVYGGQMNFLEPILEKLELPITLNPSMLVQDAKTIWFEWADDNAIRRTNEYADYLRNKNVIVRLHAFEAYSGYHHKINWSVVNHLIVVSEHIKQKVSSAIPNNVHIHVIPNGIDISRWDFRERGAGPNIAVVGHFQFGKGSIFLPHIAALLPNHVLHVVGENRVNPNERDGEYFYHMLRVNKLEDRVKFHPQQLNLNQWYEDNGINYILTPSLAESFHVSTGEAMAKGIKPIIGNFMGAEGLWPVDNIYNTIIDIPRIIESAYDSNAYRKFVDDRYEIKKVTATIRKLIK